MPVLVDEENGILQCGNWSLEFDADGQTADTRWLADNSDVRTAVGAWPLVKIGTLGVTGLPTSSDTAVEADSAVATYKGDSVSWEYSFSGGRTLTVEYTPHAAGLIANIDAADLDAGDYPTFLFHSGGYDTDVGPLRCDNATGGKTWGFVAASFRWFHFQSGNMALCAITPDGGSLSGCKLGLYVAESANAPAAIRAMMDALLLPTAHLSSRYARQHAYFLTASAAGRWGGSDTPGLSMALDVIEVCRLWGCTQVVLPHQLCIDEDNRGHATAASRLNGGVTTMVAALQAAGLSVGLNYFPYLWPSTATGDNSYNRAAYSALIKAANGGGTRITINTFDDGLSGDENEVHERVATDLAGILTAAGFDFVQLDELASVDFGNTNVWNWWYVQRLMFELEAALPGVIVTHTSNRFDIDRMLVAGGGHHDMLGTWATELSELTDSWPLVETLDQRPTAGWFTVKPSAYRTSAELSELRAAAANFRRARLVAQGTVADMQGALAGGLNYRLARLGRNAPRSGGARRRRLALG